MISSESSKQSLQEVLNEFPAQMRSLVIGSPDSDEQCLPHSSYAPFVQDANGNFYVFLSGLAEHTANLEKNGVASVLFLEDESRTANIFARRRLTLQCRAEPFARKPESGFQPLEAFESRFGSFFTILVSMPDFRFFKLTPESGRLVLGFGQAYTVVRGEEGLMIESRPVMGGHGNPHMRRNDTKGE